MKKAQKLDPLTPITSTIVAQYYYNGRRKDEAISLCQKINAMNPDFSLSHSILGLLYEQEGKFEEALAEFNEAKRIDPKQPFIFGYLGHAYASLNKKDLALAMISRLRQIMADGTYVDPFSVAIVYVGLGDKAEAFAWLEKALQERSESLLYYKDAPILDSLRSDPRFIKLLEHMGLAP
jgi:tetratricopeptide (TPR) repeat protein